MRNKPRQRRSTAKEDHERRCQTKAVLHEIKSNCCCWICQNSDHRVLEFHHMWEKSFGLSTAIRHRRTAAAVYAEIKKCVMLCRNCHRICHIECEI